MKKKTMKQMLAGVLLLAVTAIGFTILPEKAEASSTSVVKPQPVTNTVFKDCIDSHKVPEYTLGDSDNVGYLFAGWYKDEALTEPIESSTGITTGVYAKFVPSYLTGIACQIDVNDADADTRNLRIVSLVHDKYYSAVGFNIYGRYDADGDGTNESEWLMYSHDSANKAESTTLYKGLYAYEASTPTLKTPVDVFGIDEEKFYFTTVSITGIGVKTNQSTQQTVDFKDATMAVKPYWITLDGTYVEGMGEFNRVNDYYDKIVNVSVNIKNATSIAAGLINVECPKGFTLVEGECGRVFDAMEAAQKDTLVKCAGNVQKKVANSDNPNEVYINLRFKVENGTTVTLGKNLFQVSIPEDGFCDIDESVKTDVDVWNIQY